MKARPVNQRRAFLFFKNQLENVIVIITTTIDAIRIAIIIFRKDFTATIINILLFVGMDLSRQVKPIFSLAYNLIEQV